MCVISISLSTTTPAGSSIVSSNGRYRRVGDSTWIPFVINLSSPQTPNITEIGNYELQVNVTNSLGTTSDYTNGTFLVTDRTCDGSNGGNNTPTITRVGNVVNNNCFSQQCFTVTPPDGQSSTVLIEKNGGGAYYGSSACNNSTLVSSDLTEVISSPKTYSLGIYTASGGGGATANTSITISVQGGNSLTLTRTHNSPVEIC